MNRVGNAAAKTVVAVGLLVASVGGASAQTVQAGPLELDFTGRAQVQFNTTSVDEGEVNPPSSVFEMRRVRFGTNFAYDGWITGKMEAELTGDAARLTDGYIDVALADAFAIRAGQFKKPFGLLELESNTRIITIERAVRIRGVEDLVGVPGETHWLLDESGYLGRQIGVMVHGEAGGLAYAAGMFNGEGSNADEELGSKAYAGRLAYAVAEPLVVGGAVSVQPTGVFDGEDEVYATAWSLDAQWGGFREPGLRVMAEAMAGDDPLIMVDTDPVSMIGAQVAASWFAPRDGRVEGIEPLVRVSWADPDTDGENDEGLLLTPGVNFYFTGRNRLMVNGEVYVPGQEALDTELGLVAQLQIYF
jgi:hypothetical protein